MEAIKEKILNVYPHIFPALLFISLEIQNAPIIPENPPALFVSVVLLYVSLWALYALTGRVFLSGLVVSIVLLTFYTANFMRQMQTGQVLLPQDLNLAKHIDSILAFINISVHWRPICSILCAAALNVPLFHSSRRFRLSIKKRAFVFAISGAFMSLALFSRFSQKIILSMTSLSASANESYNDIYREEGALLGFYAISVSDGANDPERYSRDYLETLLARVADDAGAIKTDDGEMPNVIVIMSEAYWDPCRLPNITFSEDPAPNLRRLSGTATSGNIIAPTFGGMTCNTEFEFLTGHSMVFAGYGDIPYYEEETYIDRDNGRSLVSMFKANGYETVAFHTYTASFFERDSIYPKLGFDTFIAEEDLPDAQRKGSLRGQEIISDEYFCDVLIDMIENAAAPLFLFGITVQNHTPYLPDKYESTRIQADSGGLLTFEDEGYMETYLEGIYDADRVLGRLYDYVMESDKPAILVYFGDHLPLLTLHTGIYTDLGYISEGALDDLSLEHAYNMFAAPYIAFSNFSELPGTWGDVSPFLLGAIIADAAGIDLNLYYRFLVQSYARFQAMNSFIYVTDSNIYGSPLEEDMDIIEMFAAFQYDKLFGEGYLDEAMAGFP